MLLLLDRDETFIASLPYNNPLRKRELNGLNTFEVETSKEVEDGQRLVFKDSLGKWNEYIIYDHFKTHDKDGVTYEVYAEDSTSELYGTYIDDLKPRKAKATAILGKILENTRFEVGKVDDFGVQSFNLYHTNAKKALWTILEKYGAEIQVRIEVQDRQIIHRYIDLKKRIGQDNGKRFTYKKDTQDIKKTTSTKNLATKIYVYGKGEEAVDENGHSTGGYGRKINFAEINNGKKYLEDEEARLLYGYGKERKHIEATVEFSDCEDKAELLELGKKALKEKSKPEITYELKVEDISRYDGHIGEGVDLGDTVLVIDQEINVRVQTRVVSITDNPLEEIKDSEIVLGNFIKDLSSNQTEYEKLKNQLENRNRGLYDELQKLAEGVEGSYIDSVVERFNEELNATGGWVYAEKGEGIIILNAPRESGNATQAIKLAGGIIGIANSKKSNGDFDYRTFGDGNGFTADLITAGILKGGKVHWNLEDGTFIIGKDINDYSMYWDGSTLHLRDVDIDLENHTVISGINEKIKNTDSKLDNSVEEINGKISETDNKITSEVKEINQKLKVGEGKVESSIQALREETIEKDNQVKKYVSDNFSTISQTDQKIETKVGSVSREIDTKTGNLKNFLERNYSTTSQTNKLIEQKVSSVTTDVSGIKSYVDRNFSTKTQTSQEISQAVKNIKTDVQGVKNFVTQNYSTTTQTNQKIEQSVSSLSGEIDTKTGNLRNYVNSNFSTTTQTSNMISSEVATKTSEYDGQISSMKSDIRQTSREISSKVSKNGVISAINQSAESVKIKANKINLTGDVTLKGNFISEGDSFNDRHTRTELRNGRINFYDVTNTLRGTIKGEGSIEIESKVGLYMKGTRTRIGNNGQYILMEDDDTTYVKSDHITLAVDNIKLYSYTTIEIGAWKLRVVSGDKFEISYGSNRRWGLYIDSGGIYRLLGNTKYKLAVE